MRHVLMTSLLCCLTGIAHAAVNFTLSKPANPVDAERGIVELKTRNDGDKVVYLFAASTVNHAIFTNVFCIRDVQGRVAEHRIHPGYIPATPDAFMRLDPHSERTDRVDLDYVYDLPDGPIDVTYSRTNVYDRPDADTGTQTQGSNTLRIWINRSLVRPASDHPYWQRQISYNSDCDGPFVHER